MARNHSIQERMMEEPYEVPPGEQGELFWQEMWSTLSNEPWMDGFNELDGDGQGNSDDFEW